MDRVGRYGDDPEIEPGDLWVQRVGRLHVAAWSEEGARPAARIAAGEAAGDMGVRVRTSHACRRADVVTPGGGPAPTPP